MRNLTDIVENSKIFNSEWYRSVYLNAAPKNLSSADHFVKTGQWIGYDLAPNIRHSDESVGNLLSALRRQILVSYCIPVMNRPNDIKSSLRENLAANQPLSRIVEFIIIFFDTDFETHNWVKKEFDAEINNGYLRLIHSNELLWWHFSRAKNSFKDYIRGRLYSSLDGDNFITLAETAQIIDAYDNFGDDFVFHHFSGNWGDGTSGRITLPSHVYQNLGYDNRLLPRQFDEIDALISALVEYPGLKLLRYDTKDHAFSSKRTANFLKNRPRLPPETVILPQPGRKAPINPRGSDYVAASAEMSAQLRFNQAISFWKNSITSERPRMMQEAYLARHHLIDKVDKKYYIPWIISQRTLNDAVVRENDISLFTCVKDDEDFLPLIYEHYKSLGVTQFFIVDDGSLRPVETILPYDDVHVFQPEVGSFATSKGLWLEALIWRFLKSGMWALTVDADEFIDIPESKTINDMIAYADDLGLDNVPAILLDMLPSENLDLDISNFSDIFGRFDHHAMVLDQPLKEYLNNTSIKWGFGDYAYLSWLVDARFHAFKTYDSLRKIPLFRVKSGCHLNQGFHDIHFSNSTEKLGNDIWSRPLILPIRHYKLLKVYEKNLFNRTKQHTGTKSEYFSRTAINMGSIFGGDQLNAIASLSAIPTAKYNVDRFCKIIKAAQLLFFEKSADD